MKKNVRIGLETSSLMPLVALSPFSSSVYNRIIDQNSYQTDFCNQLIKARNKNKIYNAFNTLFKKFRDAAIVVSYRSDGIPPITDLKKILRKYKPIVREERYRGYKYVLSNNNSEVCLLLGLDGKS